MKLKILFIISILLLASKVGLCQEWSGTGFALNNGYVATNYHVVEDAKSINISGINGDFSVSYNAIVVATDKINDLAIVKIRDSRFHGFGTLPYAVEMKMAEVGDDVFVLGYPLIQTMGDEIKLTNGIISSRTGFQGDVSIYQMSAPIQPGNSGGPMFNSKGNVIGIVCAHHKGAENVGYAIKTSYLKNLAESASLTNVFPINNTVSTMPLSGQVKKLKRFVYLIKCSGEPGQSFITSAPSGTPSGAPVSAFPGALPGDFSVASGRTVKFSKGNLQYQASTGTWRFAERQWDYIGLANSKISSSYSGWIDLFGWGTSGWNNGNTYYQPYNTDYSDGSLYGPVGSYNLTGSYARADWGVNNAISNGGNAAGLWRTLTIAEWEYLFDTRSASTVNGVYNARYAKGRVAGVAGVILFPDSYSHPGGVTQPTNINTIRASFDGNSYTVDKWAAMQSAGAVFLPAAGFRVGTGVGLVGSDGDYWSSSYYYEGSARSVGFDASCLHRSYLYRYYGRSVRLVRG